MLNLWECQKCKTENPENSNFCQTCGENKVEQTNIKSKPTTRSNEKKKPKTVSETLFGQAASKLRDNDYSVLEMIANISILIGVAAIVFFIVLTFISFGDDFSFLLFLSQLLTTGLIALSCFAIAYLIELLVLMKQEVNYLAQCNYVNVKINEQILETLQTMKESTVNENK